MSKLAEMLAAQKPPGFSGQHRDPSDPDVMVPKALRTMEDTQPARKIAKGAGFSVEHLKKTWLSCVALFLCLNVGAGDVNKGQTFQAGDTVTHTKLNNLVDLATINTTFYTDKSSLAPASADTFLYYSAASAGFRKTTMGTLLLDNTALITGQSEDTAPAGGDFLLTYDISATGFKKTTLWNVLSNVFLMDTNLIVSQPATANPLNSARFQITQGGTNNSLTLSNLYRSVEFGLTTFTNLAQHTAPTNQDELLMWSSAAGSNRFTTLIGLITNAPNMPTGDYTNMDNVTFPVAYINNAGTTTVYKKLPMFTLLSYMSLGTAVFALPAQLPTKYTTVEYGVTNGVNAFTEAHSLGGVPHIVRWVLVCQTNEIGYVVGDEVDVSAAVDSGSANTHVSFGANSTDVWLTVNVTGSLRLNNKTTGSLTTLSPVVGGVVQNWHWKGYVTRLNH